MFTGIIERLGSIKNIKKTKAICQLTIEAGSWTRGAKLGESIAVNGCCLTVAKKLKSGLIFELVPETLADTALGDLLIGTKVNLERSCRASSLMGGHFVLGHVDGVGKITSIKNRDGSKAITIKPPAAFMKYLIYKGSVSVDGISLTVQAIGKDWFRVAIIPHTLKVTNLGTKGAKSRVNLEFDVLAKYVERLLEPGGKARLRKLTANFLKEQGY